MRHSKSLTITCAALGLLLAGCEGTGPNTQNGAVTGGVLGAIAGGIIGNNSGHNAVGGALIGGAIGAIAGGTIGNQVDHERGTVYTSQAQATTNVVYAQPPPPPPPPAMVSAPPPPSPDAIWINGHYDYDGASYAYVWVPGYWTIPPPGYRYYVVAHWAWRGGNYVYVRGYWR